MVNVEGLMYNLLNCTKRYLRMQCKSLPAVVTPAEVITYILFWEFGYK